MSDLDAQQIDQDYPMPMLLDSDEYYSDQIGLRLMAMGLLPTPSQDDE
ncbi:MAG: hypothetical protein ACNI26_15700 [Terasakiella sp.]